jgi:hypothetical protein
VRLRRARVDRDGRAPGRAEELRPWRRRVLWAVVGLTLLFVGAVAAELLLAVRPAVAGARAVHRSVGDVERIATQEARTATRFELAAALAGFDDAHRRITRSRALFLPGLARQRRGLLELVADEQAGARGAMRLLDSLDAVAEGSRVQGGSVPVDGLRTLSLDARALAADAAGLVRPADGLWGPLAGARRRLNQEAASSSARLADAAEAIEAARTFVGGDGDRRYLLAIQNNAEMRNQGMILSYATVLLTRGRPVFERSGSIVDLALDRPVDVPIPPGTEKVFGSTRPTQLWQSVNATADFAWSGRTVSEMYRQATGQAVDGVVAIDVPGLASLLRVLGTVQVSGIEEPLSADNLGRIILHDLYQGLSPTDDAATRRGQLAEVTRVVLERMTGGAGDIVAIASELGKVSVGGHLRLWSRVTAEEKVFERLGIGGGPAVVDADRTFHLAVENRTSTKLDYFVKPAVRQDVHLSPNGDAVVRTTVTIRNEAPAGAEPSYQLGPDKFTSRPGEYIAWVLLWGPSGSEQAGGVPESGLNLVQAVTTLGPGELVEETFETRIPKAVRGDQLRLRLVPQPRLTPMELDVRIVEAGGWKVRDPKSWQGPWDRTLTLVWRLDR